MTDNLTANSSTSKAKRHLFVAGIAVAIAIGSIATIVTTVGASTTKPSTKTGSSSSSGSSSSTKSNTTKKATGTSGSSGINAYVSCLKEHGVSLPSFGAGRGASGSRGVTGPRGASGRPPFGASGRGFGQAFNNPKFQAAAKACAKYQPQGGFGGGFGLRAGGFGFGNSQAAAAYRNCLELHGVTLPKAGQRPANGASGFDPNSSKVRTALSACAALRPKPPTGATGAAHSSGK